MTHPTLALLDGLGGPEILVIAVVVLLLFGSKRMPEVGRGLGRAIREFKRATSGVEENLREVLYEEPGRPRLRPPHHPRSHRASSAPAPATPVAAASSPGMSPLPQTRSGEDPLPPAGDAVSTRAANPRPLADAGDTAIRD